MDIKPSAMTINQLLGSKCTFSIPRYQREYSWEKNNYQEFLEDMLDGISIENGKSSSSQYFLGAMVFVGNMDKSGNKLDVVDGQQRLTTITVLFSALSDHFKEIGNDKLSEKVFDYIMTEDVNGEEVRIIQSKTSYPFFSFYIQDREKAVAISANSEEEICVKNAFEYLYKMTSEEEIKKYLEKKNSKEIIKRFNYEDFLKALRDQVINSTVVTICTEKKDEANKIFEILNAKGKKLASVDMIKNQVFSVLSKKEPDEAELKWSKVKENIYRGNNTSGLTTFFRHYWISKYANSSEAKLFANFRKTIKPTTEETYRCFLDDLIVNSQYYSQVINPRREDYNDNKQYYWLVQSLKILTYNFNITQIRTLLMALFDAKKRKILKVKVLKNLIIYLEGFHFCYNALLSRRANVLDTKYGSYARKIRACNTHEEVNKVISDLKKSMDDIYPKYQEFRDAFTVLTFSKKDNPDNDKVKYAINKLNCFYSCSKQELFAEDGSIEHILPESYGEYALNIGNMILLEMNLNSDAGNLSYEEKKADYYVKSSYNWVKKFIEIHPTWEKNEITNRAEKMAEQFYYGVLGRKRESEL